MILLRDGRGVPVADAAKTTLLLGLFASAGISAVVTRSLLPAAGLLLLAGLVGAATAWLFRRSRASDRGCTGDAAPFIVKTIDGGRFHLALLRQVDHRVIPRAVFSDPQIGVAGLNDDEAITAGRR